MYQEECCELVGEICDDIRQSIYCRQEVTLLMSLPISQFGSWHNPGGFLVDIACHRHTQDLAGQSANSGRSGLFMSQLEFESMLTFVSEKITVSAREDFGKSNETLYKFSKNLVSNDMFRYGEQQLEWSAEDKPPINAHIHQLPISPYRWTIPECPNNPVFGIAYTLSDSKNISGALQSHLTRIAMNIGDILLKHISKFLFDDKLDCFLNHGDETEREMALASFILSHHWLYPHSQSAYDLLCSLCTSKEEVKNIYVQYGFQPPCSTECKTLEEPMAVVDLLVKDFLALMASKFRLVKGSLEKLTSTQAIEGIRSSLIHVLYGLTSIPVGFTEFGKTIPIEEHQSAMYFSCIPPNGFLKNDAHSIIPVFSHAQMDRTCKRLNRDKNLRKKYITHKKFVEQQITPNRLANKKLDNKGNRLVPDAYIDVSNSTTEKLSIIEDKRKNYWSDRSWLHKSYSFSIIVGVLRVENNK